MADNVETGAEPEGAPQAGTDYASEIARLKAELEQVNEEKKQWQNKPQSPTSDRMLEILLQDQRELRNQLLELARGQNQSKTATREPESTPQSSPPSNRRNEGAGERRQKSKLPEEPTKRKWFR